MKLYVLRTPAGVTVHQTYDYLDAIHYQTLHPDCVLLKFYLL